jgi:hypothetical protein
MKWKLLSLFIAVLLLTIVFSGCFEDNKKQDESNMFYGIWHVTTDGYFLGTGLLPSSGLTYYKFYNNGTGDYCIEDKYRSDIEKINWYLTDDGLCLEYFKTSLINWTECYNYSFSNDFKTLSLTRNVQYETNPLLGDTEMILNKIDFENENKPDIRIVPPVDIEITEYDMGPLPEDTSINVTWLSYNVTFGLNEINGITSDVLVRLNLYFYNNETGVWEQTDENQKNGIYFVLAGGNNITIPLSVWALKPNMPYSSWYQFEERKINISVMTIYGITDTYEKDV